MSRTTITAMIAAIATGSAAAISVAIIHLEFNCIASLIVYPLRKAPMLFSIRLAALAYRSRVYPLAYIVFCFFLLPFTIIFLFHWQPDSIPSVMR